MRKLSSSEREYVLTYIEFQTKQIKYVMNFFRGFGCFLIAMIVICIISGEIPLTDAPFAVFGCGFLFLVFFMFPGFLAKKNQWMMLRKVVQDNSEYVFEGILVKGYRTRHGQRNGAAQNMATVSVNGREIRCNADSELVDGAPGNYVLVVTGNSRLDGLDFKFAINDGK